MCETRHQFRMLISIMTTTRRQRQHQILSTSAKGLLRGALRSEYSFRSPTGKSVRTSGNSCPASLPRSCGNRIGKLLSTLPPQPQWKVWRTRAPRSQSSSSMALASLTKQTCARWSAIWTSFWAEKTSFMGERVKQMAGTSELAAKLPCHVGVIDMGMNKGMNSNVSDNFLVWFAGTAEETYVTFEMLCDHLLLTEASHYAYGRPQVPILRANGTKFQSEFQAEAKVVNKILRKFDMLLKEHDHEEWARNEKLTRPFIYWSPRRSSLLTCHLRPWAGVVAFNSASLNTAWLLAHQFSVQAETQRHSRRDSAGYCPSECPGSSPGSCRPDPMLPAGESERTAAAHYDGDYSKGMMLSFTTGPALGGETFLKLGAKWWALASGSLAIITFLSVFHFATTIIIPAGILLSGLAYNKKIAAARVSIIAQINDHTGTASTLAEPSRQQESWHKLPVGMNSNLKVYLVRNCALMPRAEELKGVREDKKRATYWSLKGAFMATPMSRVYEATKSERHSGNKARLTFGLQKPMALRYARKFIVLGRRGLEFIAEHGEEPPWFKSRYMEAYGTPPPA